MVKIGKGLNRCAVCLVPKELCYCARVKVIDNRTPVTIIMHKRERFLTSNTAAVATRALNNSEIVLRGMPERSASEEIHLRPDHVPLVLFPSDDALTLGSKELESYLAGRSAQLIVPDGSWGQAKRVAKREAALKNVQAVKLADLSPSLYRLRRQVKPGRLCTFEAIARALGTLESLEVEQELMKVLAAMDHAHAMARGMDKFDDGNPDPLTQRLFVGIRAGQFDSQIEKLQHERPDFDWVDAKNYHLTLAFIGRLRRSQKERLIQALQEIRFDSFALEFHALDAFDHQGRPAVLWLKPKASPPLVELAMQVRKIITAHGIPFEDKPYTPHWTLARTRGVDLAPNELAPWFERPFNFHVDVERAILFEGHGNRMPYEEVASFS